MVSVVEPGPELLEFVHELLRFTQDSLLVLVVEDRDQDHLNCRQFWRDHGPLIVAVDRQHDTNLSRGDRPGVLPHELLVAFTVDEYYVEGLREVLSVRVPVGALYRLAV